MDGPERIQLPRGCERFGLSYSATRNAYLQRKISGGRDEHGRILLDVESLEKYVADLRGAVTCVRA